MTYKPMKKVVETSSAQHNISKKSTVDCEFGAIYEKQKCSELENERQIIGTGIIIFL